jgi:hypothetical protein
MKKLLILSFLLCLNVYASPSSGGGYGDDCSTESKTEIVKALDSHFTNVLEQNIHQLNDNLQFSNFVNEQIATEDVDDKIAGYLQVLGVDADQNTEEGKQQISSLIGARDLSNYIANAETNLALTAEQADFLVRSTRGSIIKVTTKNTVE